ncbi:hypothetical protein CROQUDRAFT_45194 [Cronartium quercuum f. sp. fusiforme G11]|uniref:Wax synthase domain-containing protein n=1 Tax=Cronartium quercuum f. sp. fusiforme G11 TaxID=708437 RepID=A0A9P6NH69_9BASI|nr:hypothetical protein CROQUDRAFT_45194 [Cronartium quercuum f. sp. fusiforme G11]
MIRFILPCCLLILQCALLHPTFAHSKLARLIRTSLTPITFLWFLTAPFRCSVRPPESADLISRMSFATSCILMSVKALDWGLGSDTVYTRTFKIVNGVKRWEKFDQDEEAINQKLQENDSCDAFQLILWVMLLMSSSRGLQFTWGPPTHPTNNLSTSDLIRRIVYVNIPATLALAFQIKTRDSALQTPVSVFLSWGIVHFPGLSLLSEVIYTASHGIWLASVMDVGLCLTTLGATVLYKFARWLNAPDAILQLCDPIYYPPAYDSPHLSSSIAELWGRRWHALFKRTFVLMGGKPMVWITKRLGASSNTQRLMGLFGIFAASAFLHEYPIFALTHPHQPYRHLFSEFPGAGFFFLLQPLGMLIEPYVIPLIPKKLGGGKLWVWAFLILTGYPYRIRYLVDCQLLSRIRPLSEWTWLYILSPVKT